MSTITLELDSDEFLPQVSSFLLVCELNRRINNWNYVEPSLIEQLKVLEDRLREEYAEFISFED